MRQEAPQRQERYKVTGDLETDAQRRDDWHGSRRTSAFGRR